MQTARYLGILYFFHFSFIPVSVISFCWLEPRSGKVWVNKPHLAILKVPLVQSPSSPIANHLKFKRKPIISIEIASSHPSHGFQIEIQAWEIPHVWKCVCVTRYYNRDSMRFINLECIKYGGYKEFGLFSCLNRLERTIIVEKIAPASKLRRKIHSHQTITCMKTLWITTQSFQLTFCYSADIVRKASQKWW